MSYFSGCICPTFTKIITKDVNTYNILKEIFGFIGFISIAMLYLSFIGIHFISGTLLLIPSEYLIGIFITSLFWLVYGVMILSFQIILCQVLIIPPIIGIGIYKTYKFYANKKLLRRMVISY